MMCGRGFNLCWRNSGHWDVYPNSQDHNNGYRLFRIRGETGDFIVMDERLEIKNSDPESVVKGFPTVEDAMKYICSILMKEV